MCEDANLLKRPNDDASNLGQPRCNLTYTVNSATRKMAVQIQATYLHIRLLLQCTDFTPDFIAIITASDLDQRDQHAREVTEDSLDRNTTILILTYHAHKFKMRQNYISTTVPIELTNLL